MLQMQTQPVASLLALAAIFPLCASAAPGDALTGAPWVLRGDAVITQLPEYPPALIRSAKSGLVVVRLVVAPPGHVESLEILESFDSTASESVKTALSRWRFIPLSKDRPRPNAKRIGKLLFLFEIADDHGNVIDLALKSLEELRQSRPN